MWPYLLSIAVVVALLGAGGLYVRARRLAVKLTTTVTLDANTTVAGPPMRLIWPRAGEASVSLAGLGSLGSFGEQSPVPIASVAKVMTAYVILHDFPISGASQGFEITITQADVLQTRERAEQAESVVAVSAGETLSEYQLLEGLLIPSGNNMAQILAEHDGGVTAFVAKMNSEARLLGMTSTTYTDPSGFDATTVSNALDQTKMVEAAMTVPTIARIVAEKSAVLPVAGTINNFDHLLGTDGFIGLKTGSDTAAGGAFVFADRRTVDGRLVTVYGAVLADDVGEEETAVELAAVQTATRQLVDSVFDGLGVKTVLPAGAAVLTVSNVEHRSVAVHTRDALSLFGWGGITVPLQVTTVRLGQTLVAGQVVGQVGLAPAGGRYEAGQATTPIVAAAAMPPVPFSWKLRHSL